MNANQPPLSDDLEKELNEYYSSPEPQPEFVARLERGLHSKLKEQEQKKMFGRSAKLKWALGLAFAALIIGLLVTSPTVVTAMKRLFGYIPGVGLVDTSNTLRVLAEPVSQTRDGITITVNEAVLSSDKTVLVFTIENIPFDKLSHQENQPGCGMSVELRLPDGSPLQGISGQGEGWGGGYKNRFTYTPFPADVNEATLFIPCIQDVLPGVLPENWELPLRFIPAPDDMAALPVIEITPQQPVTSDAPLVLDRVIETDTGYILIGKFYSMGLSDNAQALGLSEWPKIVDADGQEVHFTTANDLDVVSTEMGVFPWAYQLEGKQFAWPLTMTLDAIDGELPDARATYEFDAGENPKTGQEWALDKDIPIGDYSARLISIRFNGDGYTFKIQSASIRKVSVDIADSLPSGSSGGGDSQGNTEVSLMYAGAPPVGKLKLIFSRPTIRIPGPWQLQWQPDVLPADLPTPAESPRACLTMDSWQAVISSPASIPSGMTGKLIAYGRILEDGNDPSPDNYGVFTIDLDGSHKQVIGQGVWPSLSPDGAQAVYAWDDGLYLANLASGEKHLIPNTNFSDYGPRWSPNGKQIAFIRIDDFNLYTINPDGTGLARVINEIEYEQLIDWTPDGSGLFYGVDSQAGISLRKLDIASGAVTDLSAVQSKGVFFDISPDGRQIAFPKPMGLSSAIYISNLDGSNRRLIAEIGGRPLWSPDGKWLMTGVLNTDLSEPQPVLALINVQDCRIIPLSWSAEQISTWVP